MAKTSEGEKPMKTTSAKINADAKAATKSDPDAKAATKPNTDVKAAAKAEAHPTPAAPAKTAAPTEADIAKARERLAATGRNEPCLCGSGKKYKKCHLLGDEQATVPPPPVLDAGALAAGAWRLFEQRRPGAAEKEFRAALALDDTLLDAHVGIGMARLSAGDAAGAKEELGAVLAASQKTADAFLEKQTKDAFTDPAAQPYIRAAHALGCLAYDENRFEDAVTDLARVHAIDDGTVGVEARLIASKALMKLEKPAEAASLLEPATKLPESGSRAQLSLGLARVVTGDEDAARKAFGIALDENPHYGKALLGRVRRHVENVAAAQPGSIEQALLYAQTYGDVWTDAAKMFLEKVIDERAAARKAAATTEPADEAAAPPA